ncbi:hypothetical protein ODD08_000293 [Salmonella enterica]|nr:hypothetical protein [Salmonella enterica]
MNISFEQLVGLYRQITFGNDMTEGTLVLTPESCELLNTLLEDTDKYGISVAQGDVVVGQQVSLFVNTPQTKLGMLCGNLAALLKSPKHQSEEPSRYYLIDSQFYSSDVPTSVIENYRTILAFLRLLKEKSAYFDTNAYECVFFRADVFKLPIRYSAETVENLDKTTLDELIQQFSDDTHKEQKLSLLIESIQLIGQEMENNKVFEYALKNVDKLKVEFDKGYRLFTSGFSYEKVLDELRTAKVEEMGRIHKVFSDIQNQILGIPVATIIVATQIKKASGDAYQTIINSAVFLGAFVFATLVMLTLFNQLQTLTAIKEELRHKKTQVDKKYASIKDDIDSIFCSVRKRLRRQVIAFWFIIAFLIVAIISTGLIYIYCTYPETWQLLMTKMSLWLHYTSNKPTP